MWCEFCSWALYHFKDTSLLWLKGYGGVSQSKMMTHQPTVEICLPYRLKPASHAVQLLAPSLLPMCAFAKSAFFLICICICINPHFKWTEDLSASLYLEQTLYWLACSETIAFVFAPRPLHLHLLRDHCICGDICQPTLYNMCSFWLWSIDHSRVLFCDRSFRPKDQ